MKARVHIVGAVFGCVCALSFAVAPFVARADAGPGKVVAPPATNGIAPPAPVPGHSGLRHMNRGHVAKRDDGCGG